MPENLLEKLNQAQLEAVRHDQGPLMIIAGAGTGKTTVITHRIAYLIEQQKAKPEEILALTFTEKAAAEMEERVDRLLPIGYLDLWISTFHSFCERILKAHALDIGIPNDFKLLNQTDAWLLVRQNFDRFNLDYYRPAGNPTKFIHALLQHFSRAKDENVSPEEYLAHVEQLAADVDQTNSTNRTDDPTEITREREVANAYHVYQQILLENEALDFGDLISYTLKLFKSRPQILEEYRRQFKYVLVDEFQDTNWAQYDLVKMLSAPKNNLTVVADDDQAIYRFRGAAMSNVLQFKDDYPDANMISLTENYRSGQAILDCAYEFIKLNNPNRLEVQLGEGMSKRLLSRRTKDAMLEHLHCASIDEEAIAVVERIMKLHQAGVPLAEFAILVRANDSAEPFIRELERRLIPYQFLALKGLYRKAIILDALALMRVVEHPFHSPSWYRILSHPTLGISPDDLVKITHECYRLGRSMVEVLERINAVRGVNPDSARRIEELLHLIGTARAKARRQPVSELYVDLVKSSGLLGSIASLPERTQQEEFRLLQQFYERMKSFEALTADRALSRFLQELEHEQASGDEGALKMDPEEGPETVKIMTVHGSKGLEFGHVFIVSLVDRRFPTSEKRDAIPLPDALVKEKVPEGDVHLEEERRLMYVALTRAKDAVYLTSADDYGGVRKKKPSRFLVEMGFTDTNVGAIHELPKPDAFEQLAAQRYDLTNAHIKIPSAFSFTQLAAFTTCPLQYKFAHILHVPVFGRQTLSFGKTMHGTLQKFFERWMERMGERQGNLFGEIEGNFERETGGLPLALPELLKIYDEAWIDEWYENDVQRENYRAKGRQGLIDYYRQIEEQPPRPLHLEKGFTVKFGDVVVRGRIDRVDEVDGGVEIIDYKTGRPKTEESISAEDKRQLMIYQIAAAQCFNPPLKVARLTYHYLEDNSRVSFLATAEELAALAEEIVATAQAIRTSDFKPTPGFMCAYCDFKDICEFRQL